MKKVERKLRSQDTGEIRSDSYVFNFDRCNSYLQEGKKIPILQETISNDDILKKSIGKADENVKKVPTFAIIKHRDVKSVRRAKNKKDVLDDSLYLTFHRRMRKKERWLTNMERNKNASEIDNIISYYDLLSQNDWEKTLSKITHINDINDKAELSRKRALVLSEISKINEKNEELKNKIEKLKDEQKNFAENPTDTESESDYKVGTSILKMRRIEARTARLNSKFKLNLGNGFSLVVDQNRNPKIIKTEALEHNYKATVEGKKTTLDQTIRKDSVNSKKNYRLELPTKILELPFSIDPSWVLKAKNWKNKRISLRRGLNRN